jgi:thioredoxin-dependent peroxiredoxin
MNLEIHNEVSTRGNVKRKIKITALAMTGIVAFATGTWAQELKIGDVAPDFTLEASDGQTYTLSKLKGKTVVLAWFPKAFTGG